MRLRPLTADDQHLIDRALLDPGMMEHLGGAIPPETPDLSGNVYFGRSRTRCGRAVRMMKWTGAGDPAVFYSFARGTDMTGTMAFDDGLGVVTVFVDFFDCGNGRGDIYSFTNP